MQAYDATKALLNRNPQSADRVFEHAQSAYWVGYLLWIAKKYEKARPYFDQYIKNAETLNKLEPDSLRGLQEIAYAYTNLGVLLSSQNQTAEAHKIYLNALPAYLKISSKYPNEIQHVKALANAYAWLADSSVASKDYKNAIRYRLLQDKVYQDFPLSLDQDFMVKGLRLDALVGLARTEFLSGNIDLAKQYTEKGKLESFILWQKDKDNIEWLQNYALFCLLNAEIAIEHSNYSLMQSLIAEYDELKNEAHRNSDKNGFFQEHFNRKQNLLTRAKIYQFNQ